MQNQISWKNRTRSCPSLHAESGAVLILSIFIIAVLAISSFGVIDWAVKEHTRIQLQTASDNAAVSAATMLCGTRSCYNQARETALQMIYNHDIRGATGRNQHIDVRNSQPTNAATATWDRTNTQAAIVQVERGISDGSSFQSTEGDWQSENPGIPAYLATNAVKVTITRTRSGMSNILGRFSIGSGRTVVVSTALKGDTGSRQVAPFAIPACALVHWENDFYGTGENGPGTNMSMCDADRVFTRADRYGQSDGWVNPPAFPWEPCNRAKYNISAAGNVTGDRAAMQSWLNASYQDCNNPNCPTTPPTLTEDGEYCYTVYGNSEQGTPFDYGLNGILSGYSYNTTGYTGGLGGYFGHSSDGGGTMLSGRDHYGVVGLPNVEGQSSGSILASITTLLNNGTVPEVSASLMDPFSILPDGLTTPDLDTAIWKVISNNGGGDIDGTQHPAISETELGSVTKNLGTFQGYEEYMRAPWLCNSKWKEFTNKRIGPEYFYDYDIDSGETRDIARADLSLKAGISDASTVFETAFPIIADVSPDAMDCVSYDNSHHEPPINPNHQYVVIGFAKGYIYDVDIGSAPPSGTFTYSNGTTHQVAAFGLPYGNCNAVRARLSCEKTFLPSTAVGTEALVKLIQ